MRLVSDVDDRRDAEHRLRHSFDRDGVRDDLDIVAEGNPQQCSVCRLVALDERVAVRLMAVFGFRRRRELIFLGLPR